MPLLQLLVGVRQALCCLGHVVGSVSALRLSCLGAIVCAVAGVCLRSQVRSSGLGIAIFISWRPAADVRAGLCGSGFLLRTAAGLHSLSWARSAGHPFSHVVVGLHGAFRCVAAGDSGLLVRSLLAHVEVLARGCECSSKPEYVLACPRHQRNIGMVYQGMEIYEM